MSEFEDYPCVGVCLDDPDTGYCLGCGRPPRATGRTPPPPPPAPDSPAAGRGADLPRKSDSR